MRGFARTRDLLVFPPGTWWTRTAVAEGIEYRLAARLGPLHWHDFAFNAFSDRARVVDELIGRTYSASAFVADELYGCLCVGPINEPLQFAALSPADAPDQSARAFAPGSKELIQPAEPIICACFQVDLAAVRAAIACGEAHSVAQIGCKLRAGTNCGSCITELKRLIKEHRRLI